LSREFINLQIITKRSLIYFNDLFVMGGIGYFVN